VVALILGAAAALLVAILATPILMQSLAARGIGQQIRDDGPAGHHAKAGTPTMGGLAIVAAVVIGYLVAHAGTGARFTSAAGLVVLLVIGSAGIGLVDDWMKVSRQRSLGLSKKAKTFGLLAVATAFAWAAVAVAGVRTELSFAGGGIELGPFVYVLWAVLVVFAASNAVNLADGLDGLAAGSAMYSFSAFVFIGFWQFRHFGCYGVGPALDLTLVAAAFTAACAGFLWWNAAPARIFMGDTGSLAIGAGLGGLALTTNTHLLLLFVGGLFAMITLSVVIQVAVFRLRGRRVFRMAPIHHHFELAGWPETTVIVRFWILAAASTALAIGVFYAAFLAACGTPGGTGG